MDTPIKIPVVEDEMLVGAKISLLLTNLGYEVTGILPRGEEALLHVEGARPDIVLPDVSLKGAMNGIETATQLRQKAPGRRLSSPNPLNSSTCKGPLS